MRSLIREFCSADASTTACSWVEWVLSSSNISAVPSRHHRKEALSLFASPCETQFEHPDELPKRLLAGLWENGVVGKQSSWKAFPTFKLERSINVARMDKSQAVSPTLWSPGSTFSTPDHAKQRRAKQPKSFMSAIVQFSHVGLATFVLCLDQGSQFKFIWCLI